AAHASRSTLWDTLQTFEAGGTAKAGIADFVSAVSRLKAAIESGVDLVGATKQLIEDIGLYDDLRDASGSMSAAQRRIDNVTGLLGSLQRFTDKGRGPDRLAELLRALSLDNTDNEKHDDNGD